MSGSGYAQLGALRRDRIGAQKNTNIARQMFSDSMALGQFLAGQMSESKTAWEEYDAGAKTINPEYKSQNPHLNIDKKDFKLFDKSTWGGQVEDIKTRFKAFKKPTEGFDFKGTSYGADDIRAVGKLTDRYDPKLAPHAKTLYDQWYNNDENIDPTK